MRVVLQRVCRAEVRVDGKVLGKIGRGFLLLAGFKATDNDDILAWMADKIRSLRLFSDAEGKMNLGLEDVGGEILLVSQFTLYADTRKGRRPSFLDAAPAEIGEALYQRFVTILRRGTIPVATGEFGALMDVELVNDGPVTLWLEREAEADPAG